MKKNLQIGKKIALALMLLVTASVVNAQRTATTDGPWNSTTTWGGQPIPTATDAVIINNAVDVTLPSGANGVCSSITFVGTSGSINISSGFSVTVSGAITVQNQANASVAVTLSGAGTINCSSVIVGGTVTNLSSDRTTTLNSSISVFNVSGNVSVNGEDDVNDTNDGTFSFQSGTLNVGGTITLDSDTDDNDAVAAFRMDGGASNGVLFVTAATPFSASGLGTETFNFGAAGDATVVDYSGAAQSVVAATYNTLRISGTGDKTVAGATTVATNLTLSSGTLVAGTNLSMGATGTPTITRSEGSMTGTLQGTNDYDITFTGNSKTTGPEFSNTGLRNVTVNLTAGQTLTLDANRAPDGNLAVSAGTFDLSSFTINRAGAPGGTLTVSNDATLKIGGTNSFPTNYNTHSIGATSTVEYAGTAQTVGALNSAQAYGNLILSGSGNKNFAAARTVNGTLSIQGTAVATGTTPTYGASAILEYAGSAAQATTNVEFPTTVNVDLRINNAAGITLNNAKTLTGTLAFANGDLITDNTNLLTIAGTWNGLGSGASATSHVAGPLSKIGGSDFTFPIGNGTLYRPISIATLSGPATVRATYFLANPRTTFGTTGTGPALPIKDVSLCEYWDLDDGVATINAIVGLQYSAASPCNANSYITDPSTLVVAHWNGSTWENKGATGATTLTNMTASTTSTFSPFTIGTTDAGVNPLPVSFTDVKAFEKGAGVQIDWTNSTESDMSAYVIERSADGINFNAIGQTAPRSNQFDKVSYTYIDAAPLAGTNFYRIKAIELSGKNVYSKALRVDIGRSPKGISLYPNPVRGSEITIGFSALKGQYSLNVVNTAGQVVYRQNLNHAGGTVAQTVSLPAALKAGVYNVLISGDNYKETKTFVIQ